MSEGKLDVTVDEAQESSPYAMRLVELAKQAGLINIPPYDILLREFFNDHFRTFWVQNNPLKTDYKSETRYSEMVGKVVEEFKTNPDAVVNRLVGEVNRLPITTSMARIPVPISTDNMLRLIVANHPRGLEPYVTYPWSHHEQLVGKFKGESSDDYTGYDPRALMVLRRIHSMEHHAPQPPIQIKK